MVALLIIQAGQLITPAGGPGSALAFRMKVPANDWMLLMKYTLLLINEGAPRVSVTRGELNPAVKIDTFGG
jgi:hypothetical protein